jgi:hypothetical protein
LKCLDASLCTVVTEVEDKFFSHHEFIESVHLPSSVRTIGSLAFSFTSCLRILDLRCTAVDTIADGFCQSSRIRTIYFPPTLTSIGREFLSKCRELEDRLDLSHTKVSSCTVGPAFLKDSIVHEVAFPPTFLVKEGHQEEGGGESEPSPAPRAGLPSFLDAASGWYRKPSHVEENAIVYHRPPVIPRE